MGPQWILQAEVLTCLCLVLFQSSSQFGPSLQSSNHGVESSAHLPVKLNGHLSSQCALGMPWLLQSARNTLAQLCLSLKHWPSHLLGRLPNKLRCSFICTSPELCALALVFIVLQNSDSLSFWVILMYFQSFSSWEQI